MEPCWLKSGKLSICGSRLTLYGHLHMPKEVEVKMDSERNQIDFFNY